MFIVKQKLINLDQLLKELRFYDQKEPWGMYETGDGLGSGYAVGWGEDDGCGYDGINQEQDYDAGEGKGGG